MYLKTSLTAGNVIKKAVVGFLFYWMNYIIHGYIGYLMYVVLEKGKTYENLFWNISLYVSQFSQADLGMGERLSFEFLILCRDRFYCAKMYS